jgi:hypothetical protein
MKAIFSFGKHSYVKTVGMFLIAVALIAGVVGCEGEPVPTFTLTMAENPAGTGTATDDTGGSPYEEGDDVNISAIPADCYRFVSWSAPAGTFADANNATTTFTMPDQDVTVTANFEAVPPDHYKFYDVDWETAPYVGMEVLLEDQFGTFNVTVGDAILFGNPVEKEHATGVAPIEDPNRHYTLYELDYGEGEPMLDSWQVVVNNQFQDDAELTVQGPIALAVPTQKEDHEMPVCLNHFSVYLVDEADYYDFPPVDGVNLKDQFILDGEDVTVNGPVLFANPVQKTVPGGAPTPIEHEDEHYVWYHITGEPFEKRGLQIDNQFGPQVLDVLSPDTLAVPSQKISWGQPLDHFKSYGAVWVDEPPATFPADVQLEDQFITEWLGEPLMATVLDPVLFANPVNKEHGEVWTPVSNWDNHLTLYNIAYEEIMPVWHVTVDNQFGVGQELFLEGPTYLAVPTKKGPHDPPEGLDHFLVYTVVSEPPVLMEEVWLSDQFTSQWATVYPAGYFANPVKKIHGTEVTDIKHPNAHLLWYYIDGGEFSEEWLPIANQFGPQVLGVYQGWYMELYDLLGVPSQKTGFSIAD